MLPAEYVTAAAAFLAFGGVIACFAGYRLFRIVLGIYGFILGVSLATSFMGSAQSTMTLVMAAIAGGVLGAVLMIAAYFVGVGLIGAGLAALLLNLVWRFIGGDPPTVVLVIVCVLGALGALSIARFVVIFGTAITGAWSIILGALALMGDAEPLRAASARDIWVFYPLDPGRHRLGYTALWFVIALSGVVVQLTTTKGKKAKAKAKKK